MQTVVMAVLVMGMVLMMTVLLRLLGVMVMSSSRWQRRLLIILVVLNEVRNFVKAFGTSEVATVISCGESLSSRHFDRLSGLRFSHFRVEGILGAC